MDTKTSRGRDREFAERLAAQAETAADFAEAARAFRVAGCAARAERFETRATNLRRGGR